MRFKPTLVADLGHQRYRTEASLVSSGLAFISLFYMHSKSCGLEIPQVIYSSIQSKAS